MAGKTDEEIAEARDKAHAKLREMGYEFVNTLFTDEWYSDEAMEERGVVQIPLCYLAKFHCSSCDWSGQLLEYIGFGGMLAYEPVHCPKCGEKIERRR